MPESQRAPKPPNHQLAPPDFDFLKSTQAYLKLPNPTFFVGSLPKISIVGFMIRTYKKVGSSRLR